MRFNYAISVSSLQFLWQQISAFLEIWINEWILYISGQEVSEIKAMIEELKNANKVSLMPYKQFRCKTYFKFSAKLYTWDISFIQF